MQNVWVRHTKCGLWLDGPFADLHVVGVDVRNTNADGINLHGGVEWVTLEHSRFRNTGDDAIALWSDRNSGGADTNNLIQCVLFGLFADVLNAGDCWCKFMLSSWCYN